MPVQSDLGVTAIGTKTFFRMLEVDLKIDTASANLITLEFAIQVIKKRFQNQQDTTPHELDSRNPRGVAFASAALPVPSFCGPS